MRRTKSIENILIFSASASFITTLILFSLGGENISKFAIPILIVIFLLNILIILALTNLKSLKLLFSVLVLTFLSYSVLAFTFRDIRNYFPKPTSENAQIIGFAHYFGYPFLFDSFLVFLLVILPISFYLILKNKK